jgi:hypothetical protein
MFQRVTGGRLGTRLGNYTARYRSRRRSRSNAAADARIAPGIPGGRSRMTKLTPVLRAMKVASRTLIQNSPLAMG